MNVSIFGLGYVGCVSTACLSRLGHNVVGVDVAAAKVDAIAQGRPTVVEPEVGELIRLGHRAKRVTATKIAHEAVQWSDATLICVGTPTQRNGSLDVAAVRATADVIALALSEKAADHLVVLRSTVPPGTVEDVLLPAIAHATSDRDDAVRVVVIPEFLREGSAVQDYFNPPLVLVGTRDGQPDIHKDAIAGLLGVDPEQIEWVPYRQAEMLKSVCNAFHAMKVAFANEVGALCTQMGIDGQSVMRLMTRDRKLNISPAYLRPGMPYGGSCLPKDLRAVVAMAEDRSVNVPLLRAIRASNEAHKRRAFDAVLRTNGYRQVAMDGLAFKPGTDDLRESPLVLIAEFLIGKGYDLKILDPAVKSAYLEGANRQFIEEHIPHLANRLVETDDELLDHAQALVLTREGDELLEAARRRRNPPFIIDLTSAGRCIDVAHPVDLQTARAQPSLSRTYSTGSPQLNRDEIALL